MRNLVQYLLFVVCVFCSSALFSQFLQKTEEDFLLKRLNEIKGQLYKNPEKAFEETKEIEKEAKKINAKEVELQAIQNQVAYYRNKNDFEKMLITTKLLYKKAVDYKKPLYQSIAKTNLFEAYFFSDLPEKAFSELEESKKIMDKIQGSDSLITEARTSLYRAYYNYYFYKNDYHNQLKYIKLSEDEAQKYPDFEKRQKTLRVHYSYMATIYMRLGIIDSAEYYVKLSKSKNVKNEDYAIKYNNLWILGKVAFKKENYREALSYFKEAEKLEGYKNYINFDTLYGNIRHTYQKLEVEDSVRLYQVKADSLRLSIANNQNKSLHNLLNEKPKNIYKEYFYVVVIFLVLMFVVTFVIIRKNRLLVRQEKISQQYLENFSESHNNEDYSKLLEMLKANNPAFMLYFNEVFPDFTAKLLDINPKMNPSEIEFCALLKLKISTDSIARYKYITIKSVQNRKYNIRKKLNIPKGVDIYNWFTSF